MFGSFREMLEIVFCFKFHRDFSFPILDPTLNITGSYRSSFHALHQKLWPRIHPHWLIVIVLSRKKLFAAFFRIFWVFTQIMGEKSCSGGRSCCFNVLFSWNWLSYAEIFDELRFCGHICLVSCPDWWSVLISYRVACSAWARIRSLFCGEVSASFLIVLSLRFLILSNEFHFCASFSQILLNVT